MKQSCLESGLDSDSNVKNSKIVARARSGPAVCEATGNDLQLRTPDIWWGEM